MRARTVFIGFVVVAGTLATLSAVMTVSWILERSDRTLLSSGERREYLLHIPRGYDSAKPTPLVISMHGAGGWPAQQMDMTRWNALADERGFIVAYPSGTGLPKVWQVGADADVMKDVHFIGDLIDSLQASYNVDPSRVFANGLSNGGGMAFVLSCTMSDRIAAVGLVAAAMSLPWSWCTDRRAVPMIAFHGTADPIVPYDGGRSPLTTYVFASVPSWTANWAERNRCDGSAVTSTPSTHVVHLEYRRCAGDADVELFRIDGGGHTWPGGEPLPEWMVGTTSREVDATRLMWEFFVRHPRGAHA